MKPEYIEKIWNEMEDVLFIEGEDEELELAEDYHLFEKGTPRLHLWRWFDDIHPKGVYWLFINRD